MSACTRCHGQLEHGDLRCAICALPAISLAATERQDRAKVLRCTDCNAAIAFSPAVQAPRCAFCGATMAIEQLVDPLEVAEVRLPFTVDRAAAEASLRGWLGNRGWFAPSALRDEAVLESLTPLCWAGWVVSAQATVAWTADSDEGAKRSAWAPHAGKVPMRFESIVVPASRGLTLDECRKLIPYYDLRRTEPVGDDFVESFDAQRSAARVHVQRGIEATARTRVEPHIPGRRYRNIRVACLLQGQTTQRVALPAWVLAYRYRGAAYRAIVHGQRPEVVFGAAPTNWTRVALVVLGALAVVAAIITFFATR
ncbi:MAG: zinc ribbon domain-containing protein [Deltaproteobacteria bacterium]|nr:zinc ribbon domain-containing protein [Deltaproteobacteria bacterium]